MTGDKTKADAQVTGAVACEQAHLRENWGKEGKKEKGEGEGREHEPARMTFNMESFAYRFSMLKS